MRKLFWILIILVIILTVAMIIIGVISRLQSLQTTPNEQATSSVPSDNAINTAPAPVIIQNFAYNPSLIRIARNGIVLWTNHDSTAHTVIFDNGKTIGILQPGQSAELKFDTVGIFDYHCSIHPWMKGQVVVGE